MATVKRWDVCTPRPKSSGEGSWWLRVGMALESDRGMITVYLDAVPLPDKDSNQIKLMLFEPKERDAARPESKKPAPPPASGSRGRDGLDEDEIPF